VKKQKVPSKDMFVCSACGGESPADADSCMLCGQSRGFTPLQVEENNGKALEDNFGKMYDGFDKDKAGEMDLNVIKKLVFQDSPAKNKDFVDNVDCDGDGKVSRDEFVAYMTYTHMDKVQGYNALFNEIDVDHDGTLTKEELRGFKWWDRANVFSMLGISNWHALTAKIAKDGAKVTRQQFIDHMKALPTVQKFPHEVASAQDAVKEVLKPVKWQPAWKQAMQVKVVSTKSDPNRCWDYSSGYCYRGARCHYKHIVESQVDKATLDAHKQFCLKKARAAGVNLDTRALQELQTLTEKDALSVIQSVGPGGAEEHVYDKSSFVVHQSRKTRMKAGSKQHPDWSWYHGSGRRSQAW